MITVSSALFSDIRNHFGGSFFADLYVFAGELGDFCLDQLNSSHEDAEISLSFIGWFPDEMARNDMEAPMQSDMSRELNSVYRQARQYDTYDLITVRLR